MSIKFTTSLILFTAVFHVERTIAADNPWIGEWGHWAKPEQGAGIKIADAPTEARLRSEDGSGHRCDLNGKFEVVSETEATIEAKAIKNARTCKVVLTQNPSASQRTLKAAFEGRDCLKFCDSEKAQDLPEEFPLLSDVVYSDPLPWPECQSKSSVVLDALCTDADLSKRFLALRSDELAGKKLQSTFYVEKSDALESSVDPIKTCDGKDDAKACLTDTIESLSKTTTAKLAKLRKLKRTHDADLTTNASASESKKAIGPLKGTYSRKFRSGSTSGDKFDVVDDLRLDAEDDELTFDLLLNFFDEQECTLSGSAMALKSGRFLYRDAGRGKKADPKCRLLIFKEGSDIVVTDDPPGSCRSHCGKGGSFNARFPLSSRK